MHNNCVIIVFNSHNSVFSAAVYVNYSKHQSVLSVREGNKPITVNRISCERQTRKQQAVVRIQSSV